MTTPDAADRARVGIRVDASRALGVGHAVRMLALCQELRSRRVPVSVFGDLGGIGWLTGSYDAAAVPVRPADTLPDAGLSHLVIDGYPIPASVGAGARARGIRTLTMIDDTFGAHQVADVYVDQNYGARQVPVAVPDAVRLVGPAYALFRDEVRGRQGSSPPAADPPRVLVVFGGTDPYGAAEVVVPLLQRTGTPAHLVVVCPRPQIAARLRALPGSQHQHLEILDSIPDLAALAVTCDAAVSAAGSTIWELLCLGVPTASVCVVDNQEPGYLTTVQDGIVLAGGRLPHLREPAEQDAAVASYRRLLGDDALRASLRTQGRTLVDGRGRERVADVLLGGSHPSG